MSLVVKAFWLLSAFLLAAISLDESVPTWIRTFALVGCIKAVGDIAYERRSL